MPYYYIYRTMDGSAKFSFRFVRPHKNPISISVSSTPNDYAIFSFPLKYNLKYVYNFGFLIDTKHKKDVLSLSSAKRIAQGWAEWVWKRVDDAQNQKYEIPICPKPLKTVRDTSGALTVETGGVLIGYRFDYVVRDFIFDHRGSSKPGAYDPDVKYLNQCLKKAWEQNGMKILGFLHSHPRGVCRPSGDYGNGIGDTGYVIRIFKHIQSLNKFLVPIVYSTADGGCFEIFPFIVFRENPAVFVDADLKIVT